MWDAKSLAHLDQGLGAGLPTSSGPWRAQHVPSHDIQLLHHGRTVVGDRRAASILCLSSGSWGEQVGGLQVVGHGIHGAQCCCRANCFPAL